MFLHDYKLEVGSRMEIAAASLESMVKNTDYVGMMRQANSLLITQGVVGVKILDGNQQPLIQKGDSLGFFLQQAITHDNEQIGSIQVTFSNAPIKDKIKALVMLGGFTLLIGVPLAAVLMWFVSGKQTKDILTLSLEVQKLGDIESENINLTGINRQDEIGYLARALAERNDTIRESKRLEQLLFHAINQSHDSIVITDSDARIEFVNPAFSRITGYSFSEAIGQNPSLLQSGKHPARFYEVMWKRLTKGKTWKGLITNKRKNGEEYHEEVTITPVIDDQKNIHHYVAMKRDVTQEIVLKRKLSRAEKMEAIGLMAGGVAHDLNNILSGITGYPELLLMDLAPDSKLRRPIEAIQESAKRAATVVDDLLTVARGVAAVREVHDLNSLIQEYLDSPEFNNLKSLYPNIIYRQQFDADHASISCSPVHIKKCLMNLVTNATEALSDEGMILISTQNQYTYRTAGDIKEGDYVVLTVQDTGPGIPETDLEHIFEPFYTKKVMGRSGSGLGLAIVWNTVTEHKAFIRVASNNSGTSFTLYFPLCHKKASRKKAASDIATLKGNGSILVVDDEEQQRDIASQMLTILGYSVNTVASGEEAVAYCRKTSVDLLILDMLMEPGINGLQTYQQIIKTNPSQKAIVASGFSESNNVIDAKTLGVGSFIKKPYSIEQLGVAVQKELRDQSKAV